MTVWSLCAISTLVQVAISTKVIKSVWPPLVNEMDVRRQVKARVHSFSPGLSYAAPVFMLCRQSPPPSNFPVTDGSLSWGSASSKPFISRSDYGSCTLSHVSIVAIRKVLFCIPWGNICLYKVDLITEGLWVSKDDRRKGDSQMALPFKPLAYSTTCAPFPQVCWFRFPLPVAHGGTIPNVFCRESRRAWGL